MGLENRDYYRDRPGNLDRPSAFADIPSVCKKLLIANVAFFVLQIFFTRPMTVDDLTPQVMESIESEAAAVPIEGGEGLTVDELIAERLQYAPRVSLIEEWAALDPSKVSQGQVWRLVTSAFCHDRFGVWHIIINMLFLFWFGCRLEQLHGSREFAWFYFASAIVSSAAYLLLRWYTGDMTPGIGASGAVWGVVALYAIQHPYERVRIYFLFPVEIRWLVLLYLIFDLHPVLLALSGQPQYDGVGHAAHLGGALFGFGYYMRSWNLVGVWRSVVGGVGTRTGAQPKREQSTSGKSENPSPIARAPSVRPSKPRPNFEAVDIELEIQLDDVLAKISRDGRDSLTEEEQRVLDKASEHFQKKGDKR